MNPKDRANDKPRRLAYLRDLERIIFSEPSGVAIFVITKPRLKHDPEGAPSGYNPTDV